MTIEHTRLYLSRVVPWVPGSYVNIHWSVPNPRFDPNQKEDANNRKMFLNGRAFETLDAAVNYVTWLQTRADTQATYVCMSAQALAEQLQYKTGYKAGQTYNKAVRAAVNATGLKSIFLDIDVKPNDPDKGYASTADAINALKAFLKETGLPLPTMMVSSGTGGMHVYWVFDTVLQTNEWQYLANALSEATRRCGLKVDTQCTVNPAQVLRPPNTLNKKQVPTRRVELGASAVQAHDYTVDQIRTILTPYAGAVVTTLPTARVAVPSSSPNSELSAGIQTAQGRPIDIDTVAVQCGFVREALDTGGKAFGQPLWNLSTMLAQFTTAADGSDGRAQAHRMAKGHPGYDTASTDALYDRKVAEKDARNMGWPSCKSINNAGCTACGSCTLAALGKSPLSFGTPYSAPVTPLAAQPSTTGFQPSTVQAMGAQAPHPALTQELPAGFVYNQQGIPCRVVSQPDGSHSLRPVCYYSVSGGWLQVNPWVLHFVTQLGSNIIQTQVSIPLNVLQSREFAKPLAAQGFVVNREHAQELQAFLMAWVNQLQNRRDATVASSAFGWSTVNSKIEGFVYNNRLWCAGPDKPAATPQSVLEEHYKPHGDLIPWQQAAKFMTDQRRPGLDAILAASFGAPLIRFTGQSGVIVSAYSQATGIGKSTMMMVGQSVWGHPVKTMNGLDDTQNSVINKAGQLRSLPLLWDELKGDDQKQKFVKLAFQISGGKEKSRMTADAVQRDPGTWQTIVIAASNDSLTDNIMRHVRTNEAGIVRVFEFEIPVAQTAVSHGVVARLVGKTQDHYGQAGLVYAKFLGANHERIAHEIADLQDKLTQRLGAQQDERFWIAGMVCIIAGARYANELGLTTIDEQGLLRFLVDALKRLRNQRAATSLDIQSPSSLSNVFQQFLGDHRATSTLTTDSIPLGKGRPAVTGNATIGDHSRLGRIVVRHATKDNIILFSDHEFRKWCEARQYAPHALLESMAKVWGVTKYLRSLGAGTEYAQMREYVHEFIYAGKPDLHDFMDRGGTP